jgi:hypothetical protein
MGRTHGLGDRRRHRGFADPARTDDSQQTTLGQLRRQPGNDVVSADDASKRHGQVVGYRRSPGVAGAGPLLSRVTGATKV